MKKLILILGLVLPVTAYAQTAALQGHSYLGGTQASLSGMKSTNYLNGIIPSATITVYLTGTQTKATIYADANGTPLSNPFTSNVVGSVNPGGWVFWAAINQGYDVVASGGISPNTYSQPVTICTDCYPGFSFTGTGLSLQHNSTNVTDQSLFNALDNGTIPPDSGYTLAKWLTNSTGGWAAEVPTALNSFNGQCPLGLVGLVGAFTDGSGVLKSALCLGAGPTTVAVPSGATRLLLGIDDDEFADNTGSFVVSVAVNGGTATQFTVLGTAMPWNITTNPSYTYGINDGTAAVVGATGLTAGEPIVITYLSGTVSAKPGVYPAVDANGDLAIITGSSKGTTGTYHPTLYMGAVNSGSVPASALFLGTDSNRQPVAATTANLATFLSGLTGCASAANAYVPADNQCEPVASGGVASINSTTGAFTFTGAGVSCTGTTCTFSGGGGGSGTVFCTPNAQTGTTYTLVLTDGTASGAACIGTVTMTNATNNTVTIPPSSSVAFPVPDEIDFIQLGAGQTCISAGAGVTLTTPTSLCARAQNSTIGIRQLSANTWIVFGDTQ